ncbi:topoisomerase C-terminal repeat-containing protein, partial [Enterococcus gallinarum]|uniref:topoisomerase C-terminal repeat-containing protein n=1 Tax=Enterococcus gallinarum TaxID=1353 RepID=UPI00289001DD
IVIPPAIFFYYSTLFDSRFKTLQQNRSNYPECKFTLAEHFRKKKLTKTNVKELLEGKETLVKGIKNKEKKPYNAVVKIGEKGYIDFISFSK